MVTNYKKILFLFLLFGFCRNGSAQNNDLRFERLGSADGLSNEFVTSILQDSKGYIWIGTVDGLNKYDGYSFIKYQFDPFDSNSLSQNLIYTIYEDKNNSIWVSTFEGLCKFDRSSEKFTRYKPSPFAKFSDPNISSIKEDNDGMMWVGSYSGALCRFDRNSGKFLNENLNLSYDQLSVQVGLHDGVTCIYKDHTGAMWVTTATGLHKMVPSAIKGEPSKIQITHYRYDPNNSNSLSSNNAISVTEDHSGIIWVITDKGLNSFNQKTGIFKRYQHDPQNSSSISSNYTEAFGNCAMQEDRSGNLWICTNKGINKLNSKRTAFTIYQFNPNEPNSINGNNISSLFIDNANNLWAGSWNGKLNKTNLDAKGFGWSHYDPENINSIRNNEVTSIIEDSSAIVWIGTSGGGLSRWDKSTNRFIHFRHDPSNERSLRSDSIQAMLEDRNGHLWVCNGDVLSKLNKNTGEFTHFYSHAANYKDDAEQILSITEDHEGLFWLGTVGNGIKSFDEKTGKFVHYYYTPGDPRGISDYTAISIFTDSRDNIWVGHGSIATDRLNKRTGVFTHYKHDAHDTNSISSNIVNSFFEDSGGNLWLGTQSGGLCRFDYKTGKFKTFTDKYGLPNNSVYSILQDNKNYFWLGTGKGLARFDPVNIAFTNYDYKDGLQDDFFASGTRGRAAAFKSIAGTLYFGGPNGFNFFDPFQLKTNTHIAPIVITRFNLFENLVKGASESKEIILEHDQNYFSFQFSSLSYNNPVKNQYAYKLEGVDKDWIYSGSRHYVGYTNIDPGKYTFRVKGTNNDGVWNEKGTFITIIIHPPWWRTWWAYTFYCVIAVTALLLFDRYQRQRLIQKEREKTKDRELEQAREIEKAYHTLKNTQAQLIQSEKMASLGELTAGIAHEIQNPLNFVNNFSEVNKELIDEMQQELIAGNNEGAISISKDIKDNEQKINDHGRRADTIVKSMLQHSRASSGHKESTDINALTDEYLRLSYHGMRAKDKAFNATIDINFDSSIGKIMIIPQDIGRVLLNLFNNAFYAVSESSYAKATAGSSYQPTVTVSTKKIDDKVEIRIADNGNGIPQKVQDKIFQPFFTTKPAGQGTGLGLSLSYDIVKAHGGEIKVESKEGNGARFIIHLPIV